MTALAGWENFYVIVGSSAGALIGLQFVVMALRRSDGHVLWQKTMREQLGLCVVAVDAISAWNSRYPSTDPSPVVRS